ncbi:MAG: glutamate mutase L [Oscillochloridaceae bacterium]|nr:glutamate mutase L [Chloroflexaceae bacterium]MDW8391245.1 glutamate mutase L [Oscillochloridaceae bacterium]
MTDDLGAVLVAEIGSLITRVTLVDEVDGESRMVGRAEAISSAEPPYQNVLYGVLEAVKRISEMTGRQLLREGQLIMPQNSEGNGVNHVIAVTSAAGPLTLVVMAISSAFSGRSALRASRATYTAVRQIVTLDDAQGRMVQKPDDRSRAERQVEELLRLQPDAVLIAGGLEAGASDAVRRLAHLAGLTALRARIDQPGPQGRPMTAHPVIYAGNSAVREQVIAALSDRAEIFVVDNLRPALDHERLDPARQELARLYENMILPRLPGWSDLRRISAAPTRTVCEAEGLLTRFLAERTGRRVLTVDIGASSSAMLYAAPGRFHPAILGTAGVGYGLTELLAQRGVESIARWLPFPITTETLTDRLLNRALRPQVLPSTREDRYIEHALLREALRLARDTLLDEIRSADYDWLIATGGSMIHAPEPGLALLTLLDGLEPDGAHDHPVIDVYLDALGLVPASAALAGLSPAAAVSLIDRDLLRNTPLAAVLVLLGEGTVGAPAAEVELTTVGGATQRLVVRHGDIARLPLPPKHFGQLTVRPGPAVRVGLAAPGETVSSEGGDIAGSLLGLVIDARGRPLHLPEDAAIRRARLWEWLAALGVERGDGLDAMGAPRSVESASATNGSLALALVGEGLALNAPLAGTSEVAAGATGGQRIALDALPAEPGGTARPPSNPLPAEDDLEALRKTIEPPKKGRWFGRK